MFCSRSLFVLGLVWLLSLVGAQAPSVSSEHATLLEDLAALPGHTYSLAEFTRTDICVEEGDQLVVEASGAIRLGFFAGSGGPNGIGLDDGYDIVTPYPHGALLCKVDGEAAWRHCGESYAFTARSDGCLLFEVNDNDKDNNAGAFALTVKSPALDDNAFGNLMNALTLTKSWTPEFRDDLSLSREGDAAAQMRTAAAYYEGEGVRRDIAESLYWLEAAAQQDEVSALVTSGSLLSGMSGVTPDMTLAISYWERAADLGDAESLMPVAEAYEFGIGVKLDLDKALERYRQAQTLGVPGAAESVERVSSYDRGADLTPEDKQAIGQRLDAYLLAVIEMSLAQEHLCSDQVALQDAVIDGFSFLSDSMTLSFDEDGYTNSGGDPLVDAFFGGVITGFVEGALDALNPLNTVDYDLSYQFLVAEPGSLALVVPHGRVRVNEGVEYQYADFIGQYPVVNSLVIPLVKEGGGWFVCPLMG